MDIFEIRKANLIRLIGSRRKGACAEKWEMAPAHLSQVLSNKTAKNLGEDVARRIEQKEGLPHGWLDALQTKEIAEMAEAVRPRPSSESISEQAATYQQAQRAAALMDFATPRTRSVLERINQAALAGRLTDADLDLLDQIAARFESSEGEQHASQQGSHQRLREKLQKNDPHTRK
jgi:hypothetical protein